MSVRLSLALEEGTLVLPERGKVFVDAPPTSFDLSTLNPERVTIRHRFRPDFDVWSRRGFEVSSECPTDAAAAIVVLSRAKEHNRARIAGAAAISDGYVIVDGAKTDGVDSLLKEIRKRCDVFGPVNKAHGKLFWFEADAAQFADWRSKPRQIGDFVTLPGVFSADGIDPASEILLATLPRALGQRVADFGAGWGFLTARVLNDHPEIENIYLVEADHTSIDCAKQNVTDRRASFHWEDATTWTPPERLSTVIMNPPFHVSRAADPSLGRAFITNAARVLTQNGSLWLVANRHLPYETCLTSLFREVSEVGGDRRFKVLHAHRPKQIRT